MKATKNEIIKLFINSYEKLIIGNKMAPIKFIFDDDAFVLFYQVYKNQNIKTSIYEKIDIYQIAKIKNNNVIKEDEIYIKVSDASLFFTKLQIIANLYARLDSFNNKKYVISDFIGTYLWLRLTPNDFLDIYKFLDLQISFLLNSKTLFYDSFKGGYKLSDFYGYDVYALSDYNQMMWETYNRMYFKIIREDKINSYELPSIHYGISKDTCYIYGIQNMSVFKQDKKIARLLYKISEKNDLIHPSFILSMKLMIDLLEINGINKIEVPLLEVLNYSYHEWLSDKIKTNLDSEWTKEEQEANPIDYKKALEMSSKYIDRTDEISKSKVENLSYIFYRLKDTFDNIIIDVDDYTLHIKTKEKVKLL